MATYLDFLKEQGRHLSEINPGSDEIALTADDAFKALELLQNSQTAVLGGDILSEKNNELIYAYQVWGEEYQYLNWYCDKDEKESIESYLQRSHIVAKEGIANAIKIAEKFAMRCYIVFVIQYHYNSF